MDRARPVTVGVTLRIAAIMTGDGIVTAEAATLDMEKVGAKAELAFGYLTGAIVSGMIYLGDQMGLYRKMAGMGPVTSGELAAATGLSERWLREWLSGQGAAGILDYRGDGRFELTPEGALVFADEENPASVIGGFGDLPDEIGLLRKLPEAFRTGLGYTYDDGGEAVARGTARLLGPWNRTSLVSEALPQLEGVVAKLEAGAKVADVGCGAGLADLAMARAFPGSEFHGYDNSVHALAIAEEEKQKSGLTNVFFHNVATEPMPATPTFDLVTCLDCLHDMDRPDLAAAAIRRAIKDDGTWFIVDVACGNTFEENLENPLAAMMYGFSVMLCMSSSASSAEGLALGTVGLPAAKMEALTTAAGFTRFQAVPGLEHPFNAYYEVRV
jgi:2-polyprenyl-3-methyl-5-hydroxy-6-metoxy-1,4-benzoquinol methylase